MCMIALRPTLDGRGGHIPNAVIDTAITRHPDGFGLMWRDAKGVHTECYAPGARKHFRKALKALDRTDSEYAVHFRWATSGPRTSEMAHPYTYMDPDPEVGLVALMHNGVIDIKHDHAKESDTSAFVRLVLTRLPSRWWANEALVYLVGEAIGYSKFVIMTQHETVNLHDERGKWDNGLWYSSDHKPSAWQSYKHSGTEYGKYASDATKASDGKGGTKYLNSGKGTKAMTPEQAVAAAYKGQARTSAVTLGLLTQGEGVIRQVDMPTQFHHAGHTLTAVKAIDLSGGDADYEDAVVCDTCKTIGTVYVIDGTYYIDMGHMYGSDTTDDDDDLDLIASFSEGRVIASAMA